MRDERGPWYLLTGLVIGLAVGLAYAWVISPWEYADTSPASLRANFKDQYRALIAAAFVANGNLPRAQARLNLLGDADVARTLAEQAQRTLAGGASPQEAQALGLLAVALGQGPTPLAATPPVAETPPAPSATPPNPSPAASPTVSPTLAPTATVSPAPTTSEGNPSAAAGSPTAGGSPAAPSPTLNATANATATPLPTRTPTATAGVPFVLQDQTFVCDQDLEQPLIQVLAEDSEGDPVPGVEVVVNWEGGEDHFFTGLKPELGLGYADFSMTPGVVYTLRLADGGQPISDLTPAECETASGSRYWGSWLLIFEQP
jgi:hypothetical protein